MCFLCTNYVLFLWGVVGGSTHVLAYYPSVLVRTSMTSGWDGFHHSCFFFIFFFLPKGSDWDEFLISEWLRGGWVISLGWCSVPSVMALGGLTVSPWSSGLGCCGIKQAFGVSLGLASTLLRMDDIRLVSRRSQQAAWRLTWSRIANLVLHRCTSLILYHWTIFMIIFIHLLMNRASHNVVPTVT